MSEQQSSGSSGGVLYIVATPIGNLGDLSERAGQVLARADRVAAEDTRHTGKLLQHLGVSKPMIALHDHNERERFGRVIDALLAGEDVALVSDAGTPLISDPGYVLVREARAAGIRVCPVPGACALVAGLSAAGLPTDRFLFAGFLSAKRSGRKAALEEFRELTATLVLYESPHRILDLLADLVDVFGGERECVLGRELTKTFETFYSGPAASVFDDLKADPNGARGEFVVMVHGADAVDREGTAALDSDRLLSLLIRELPVKKAARIVAEVSGLGKNELYQRALAIKDAGGH